MTPDNSIFGLVRFLVEQYGNALLGLVIILTLLGAGLYIYKQVGKPLVASLLEMENLRAVQTASMAQQTTSLAAISKTNETISEHLLATAKCLTELEEARKVHST